MSQAIEYDKTKDAYKLLRVNSNASDDELTAARRKAQIEFRTDNIRDRAKKEILDKKLGLINAAYDILYDHVSRNLYDLARAEFLAEEAKQKNEKQSTSNTGSQSQPPGGNKTGGNKGPNPNTSNTGYGQGTAGTGPGVYSSPNSQHGTGQSTSPNQPPYQSPPTNGNPISSAAIPQSAQVGFWESIGALFRLGKIHWKLTLFIIFLLFLVLNHHSPSFVPPTSISTGQNINVSSTPVPSISLSPTPTSVPTDTPEPTDTPVPTDVPEPTDTPEPTATPVPANNSGSTQQSIAPQVDNNPPVSQPVETPVQGCNPNLGETCSGASQIDTGQISPPAP